MPTGRQLAVIFSRLFKGSGTCFELSEIKLHRNDLRGKKNHFELARVRVIGSRLLYYDLVTAIVCLFALFFDKRLLA